MLLEISIKNFAIIESISLNFEQGMTVLTGETGAGKSIIIDAMNMMLGARATTEVIRHGAPKAEIEGLFSIESNRALEEIFDEQGLELSDEIIIRREILQNGRSISRVNGQMVNLSVLRTIGQQLVDIHGQHDQEELMRPHRHIQMLDEFGDADFFELKEAYQMSFDNYRRMRKQVLDIKKNQQEHKARIEMLEFQMAEIEAANLKAGEDIALNQERDKLLNHKHIADTLTNAYSMLDNEEFSSLANVRSAMNDMESLEEFDPEYREISGSLSESYYVLEDITKRLESIIDDLDFDGNRLMQVESRLDLIHTITRKYGGSVDDVLEYFAKITDEYNLLTGNNLSSEDMEIELKKLEKNLVDLAGQVAQARHKIAQELEAEIKQELQDLYMEKAEFQVRFSKGKFSREGNESVEFYISTNPGEDYKPLVKVASGGELSRLMLAIKSAFSRKEGKTSIVFDEVDTGVSGRVAQAIAQKIHKIGQHGQVLAISHLPQVIAIADYQFFIEKISNEHSTVSTVRLLTVEERIEEVAKMLAGENVTEAALTQARELLRNREK
ncbi:DNA repair protein RecN [Streptococcus infantis]|uniref:DNA repair protein RecN n=1 Tax=Streptococcus infantis TaxID=68892 RepID=UPI001CC01EE2|nr:DNA repair protein RecN [Streptococcus infantis]MBZ2111328.1 DNA repair protein RecN [Streptococcus infantis]MBZ2113127.1 DNA repair protein RecN [Streptococcus infantis]MBZ2118971.1 DNA repair protein RecN [Streptococcus infantis]